MQPYRDGKAEVIEFNGIKFRRYPDSPAWADSRYYRPHSGHIRNGVQTLHREIWKSVHGPIPDGYHVHHKDGNPLNNDVSNLECLPGHDHLAQHDASTKSPDYMDKLRRTLEKARTSEKKRAWYKSDAGKATMQRVGRVTWEKIELVTVNCILCGKEFQTPFPKRAKYCTPYCRNKHRLARQVDFEERICAHCGQPYRVNKALKTRKYCSRKCSAIVREAEKRRSSHSKAEVR